MKKLNLFNRSGMSPEVTCRKGRHSLDPILSRMCLVSLICVLMLTIGVGNAWGETLTCTFESVAGKSFPYNDAWTLTAGTENTTYHHGGSRCVTLNSASFNIVTAQKINGTVTNVTYYAGRTSKNNTATNVYIQTSTDGSTWTTQNTYAISGAGRLDQSNDNWSTVSQNMSVANCYVRITRIGGGSSTAVRAIDDIIITYTPSPTCSTPPTIGASSNSSISVTGATVSCTGIDKGDCDIDEWGFFYKTGSSGVTTSDTKVQVSAAKSTTDVSSFNKSFTELNPNTHYYFKAYAKVGSDYYLSSETDFTTKTLTSSSSNTTYGTVSRTGRVITGSLKAGGVYGSPAYTVTGASGGSTTTVDRVGNTFTVTSNSTSNITVTINFEAKGCDDKGASSITSTSGGNSYDYGPVDEYYKYSTRQILYSKSDLGLSSSTKKGTIKSIYFYYKHTTAMSKKTDVKIYMANTDLTSLSASSYVPYSEFTQVYSGSLNCTATNSWNEFILDTPFEYNGAGSLVVMIDDNSGQYDGSSYTFYYHAATGAEIYKRSDSDNENPSTTDWSTYTAANYRPSTKFCIAEADMEEYTVNWYVNGTLEHSQTGYEGTTLTSIPTPTKSDCDGSKDFVGWYTSTYSHATVAPSYISPTKIPGSDANYYAVFATASGSGSGSVELSYTSLSLTNSYESGSTKSVSDIDFYCNDIMTGTSGSDGYQKIQFKKSSTGPGYIYNSEAMPGNITSIVLSSTTRNMTVNFGTSSNPDGSTETTTCTSSSLTATPSGNYKYFKILDAVDNAAYTGTITINYSSVSYSDYETNCCTPLGAVASVTLTKTAYTITATWPTTSGGNETGYSVQLYDNSGGSKGDAIGDPVVISGTGSANRTHTFGAKTPAGSRLTANHKYYVGVTPTYSGAGDYCPTGTETVANTTTDQTYTVTYNANGGTVTTLPSGGTYEAGDEVTVANKPTTTTKSGCTFTGWNTANDGSGQHYDANGSTTFDMLAENVVLYAEWTAKKNYFIDRMHGNWDGEHTEPNTGYNCYLREGAGYTVPDLSDDDTGSNSCVTGHAHFVGWVASGNIDAQGGLKSGYTITKGGTSGTASVDGTIYYAVWAEE